MRRGLHVHSSSLLEVKRRTSIPFSFHACHAFSASPHSFKRRPAVAYNSGAPLKMCSRMAFTKCKHHGPLTSGLQQNYIVGVRSALGHICWSFYSPLLVTQVPFYQHYSHWLIYGCLCWRGVPHNLNYKRIGIMIDLVCVFYFLFQGKRLY